MIFIVGNYIQKIKQYFQSYGEIVLVFFLGSRYYSEVIYIFGFDIKELRI